MGLVYYNPNPNGKRVGDCTVRAISKALGQSWECTYIGLSLQGFLLGDMPSANATWGAYLRSKGFARRIVPDGCPDCYTDKICALEEEGYSQAGDWDVHGYGRGSSYARRRDSRGRYSRDGYSRDGGKERMMEHLDQAMDAATTERERETIRRMLDELRRG